MNELLLIVNLVILYLAVLLWYKFFKTKGLYAFSIFATILANIEVMILIKAFGLEQTLGNVLFATTFLITDIISEVEGKKEANKLVNLNIATSILFVIVSQLWLAYRPSASDVAMNNIKAIFTSTPRIVFASLFVYAIVQKLDVWLYHKWWKYTYSKFLDSKRFLWVRNNASTLISQLVNTILYTLIAFSGKYSWKIIAQIMLTSYIIFIFTSLLDTPVIYLARRINDNEKSKLASKSEQL